MGYHTNIVIDVEVLTRSIEINIKNKEKNIEKLIKITRQTGIEES